MVCVIQLHLLFAEKYNYNLCTATTLGEKIRLGIYTAKAFSNITVMEKQKEERICQQAQFKEAV